MSPSFRPVSTWRVTASCISPRREHVAAIATRVRPHRNRIYIGTRAILRFSYLDPLEEDFQQQMYEAALRDSLTGLFNRRHLMSQLESELVRRHATPLTLVLMDIDHFKVINDRYGHLIGDAVLRALGRYLRARIRGSDLAARYGGEELAVVCRGVGGRSGVRLARRLQQELQDRALVREAPDLRISFSAGVASAPHPLARDAEGLLRLADAALYRAKHSGRNCVCSSG
jgi:two-component system, cell cycle response regulator